MEKATKRPYYILTFGLEFLSTEGGISKHIDPHFIVTYNSIECCKPIICLEIVDFEYT